MITRHAIKISNPELPNVNILATQIQDPIIGSEITQIYLVPINEDVFLLDFFQQLSQ